MYARTSTAEGERIERDIVHAISKDGALGMRDVHEAGARTVAQGVTSCRVFGLPGLAIAQSGVVEVAALREKHVMREGGSPAAQAIESNQGDTP